MFASSAVVDEVVTQGKAHGYLDARTVEQSIERGDLSVIEVNESTLHASITALPLGRGERHAIHLALDRHTDWLLIDDALARQAAVACGLQVKGTLGVLVQAAKTELIGVEQRDLAFRSMLERDDIWIDATLIRRVWAALQEADVQAPERSE